jgi:hypothetical protein
MWGSNVLILPFKLVFPVYICSIRHKIYNSKYSSRLKIKRLLVHTHVTISIHLHTHTYIKTFVIYEHITHPNIYRANILSTLLYTFKDSKTY